MIVEDGTGLPDADALIDLAYADAYHAARGHAEWAGADPEKEAAIIRATDYMGTLPWRSAPLKDDQGTAWPRTGYDGIPADVRKACAEYALRALGGTLDPDPSVDPAVEEISEQIGPLRRSSRYRAAAPRRRAYPAADRMIAKYLSYCSRVVA